MRCDFADSLLQGYFDGELTAATAEEFEHHLQQCVHCPVGLVNLDLLSERLRFAQLYEVAPSSLRKRIRSDLRSIASPTPMPQLLLWHWLAAAAALLLLAITGWIVSPVLRTDDYQVELAQEFVDAHVHSLQPGQLTSISSNDEQAMKGWFKGELTFAPPVRDFANDGFLLQGGRLEVVEGRSVAAIVYSRREHLVNVFIWRTREQDASPRLGSRQGYKWIAWRKGKIEFCAVSDAPTADLKQLQRLFTE